MQKVDELNTSFTEMNSSTIDRVSNAWLFSVLLLYSMYCNTQEREYEHLNILKYIRSFKNIMLNNLIFWILFIFKYIQMILTFLQYLNCMILFIFIAISFFLLNTLRLQLLNHQQLMNMTHIPAIISIPLLLTNRSLVADKGKRAQDPHFRSKRVVYLDIQATGRRGRLHCIHESRCAEVLGSVEGQTID